MPSSYKFITYYSEKNDLPRELLTFLEENKINYLIFPNNTSGEEIEKIVQEIHNQKLDVLFAEPSNAIVELKFLLEERENYETPLTYVEDINANEVAFYLPGTEPLSDWGMSQLSDVILKCIIRGESGNFNDRTEGELGNKTS